MMSYCTYGCLDKQTNKKKKKGKNSQKHVVLNDMNYEMLGSKLIKKLTICFAGHIIIVRAIGIEKRLSRITMMLRGKVEVLLFLS